MQAQTNQIKRLLLTLSAIGLMASSAFAGYSTVYINGEAYTVYHFDGTPYTDVDGPNGYHASGYRWPNGDVEWTVRDNGCNRRGW
jgi:hypothetical protein